MIDYKKEIARIRAERMRLRLVEAFANAREGRIVYDQERANELFDMLDALAPMIRGMKEDFAEERDYLLINSILGMVLRGRTVGHLYDRRLQIAFSMLLEFTDLIAEGRKFLNLRSEVPVEATATSP